MTCWLYNCNVWQIFIYGIESRHMAVIAFFALSQTYAKTHSYLLSISTWRTFFLHLQAQIQKFLMGMDGLSFPCPSRPLGRERSGESPAQAKKCFDPYSAVRFVKILFPRQAGWWENASPPHPLYPPLCICYDDLVKMFFALFFCCFLNVVVVGYCIINIKIRRIAYIAYLIGMRDEPD